tara:strand:+ start:545 stop:871 length:327 start_codon:yes stop_codon:yes gene_type:complete
MKIQIFDAITKENIIREATSEEIADITSTAISSSDRKLEEVRFQRNVRLQETDYLANSDVTMPDNIKTWRQSLRDIPSNHTDEDAYDLLLARDSDGQLTHSIWTQPTS